MPDPADITAILAEIEGGDRAAVDQLLPLLYPELQRIAQRHLRGERADHTLDTVALVHEAYIKLAGQEGAGWKNRAHFLAIAALAMRRILIDYAHAHNAQKRGGGVETVTLLDGEVGRETRTEDLLALDEALDRLALVAERPAKVVEMRFFGGMTGDEIAEALDVSEVTVRRDWRVARAWLSAALSAPPPLPA